ncbi:hypothetical protein TNCV_4231251 [Trichonephila clavipes]|uniref:Uncharacterized protein n=1 Tax=Trichonephila clavipes TaxID=2585209 RepID=A0A8X6SG94_TRICX|nr:hypothetical protein TNCV_4231251 [Trichonephila clavipes]
MYAGQGYGQEHMLLTLYAVLFPLQMSSLQNELFKIWHYPALIDRDLQWLQRKVPFECPFLATPKHIDMVSGRIIVTLLRRSATTLLCCYLRTKSLLMRKPHDEMESSSKASTARLEHGQTSPVRKGAQKLDCR